MKLNQGQYLSRIRSGLYEAGHKGVATGRCEFSLCSSRSVAGKETPY